MLCPLLVALSACPAADGGGDDAADDAADSADSADTVASADTAVTGGDDAEDPNSEVPEEGPGRVEGQIYAVVANDNGVATALVPLDKPVLLELIVDGQSFADVESDADGRYAFTDLVRGRYQLQISSEGGKRSVDVQIVGDAVSVMNFAIMSADAPALASAPGVAFAGDDPLNPDANHDGIVDLDDIEPLEPLLGKEAVEGYADFDFDGLVTRKDLDYMRLYFGRVVVRTGLEHQFVGTKAESMAATLDGVFTGSMAGVTSGVLSATADDPAQVTFTATGASGTITVDGIGDFAFAGNPDFVSETTADLSSNRVTGGAMTLTMDVFGEPADISGTTPDGFVVLEPGGIVSVEVIGIEGTVPEAVPEAGGEVFVAEGPCDKKEDKPCDTTQLQIGKTVGCTWALTGKAGTCILGDFCTNENAQCAIGGSCGTCTTECKLGGGGTYCNCLCG